MLVAGNQKRSWEINPTDGTQLLQQNLNAFVAWSVEIASKINIGKCTVLAIRNATPVIVNAIEDKTLPVVSKVKDLWC